MIGVFFIYTTYLGHLGKSGITAKEFSILLNRHPNSITNNSKNDYIPNELGAISALIGVMAENDIEFRNIINRLDLRKRKIRGAAKAGKFGGTKFIKNFSIRGGK